MRLTNVAQMRLPAGAVMSLQTAVVGPPGPAVPISYDQRRHAGAGDRAGSWMALAFRLDAPASLDQVAIAWAAVVSRHGTLRTVFTSTDGELALHEAAVEIGGWVAQAPQDATESTREIVRRVLDAECRPFSAPSHLMCAVIPDDELDPRPVLVMAADHCHLDMWSLLVMMRDLYTAVGDLVEGRDAEATLRTMAPARSFAEHTRMLERADPAPETVRDRWNEILRHGAGSLPCFPLPLGDVSTALPEIVEVRDILDATQLAAATAVADEHRVRITALVLGQVAEATAELSGQPLRAVFPVHSRHEAGWFDSVGWFITNSVIECVDSSPAGCAAALREALSLGSYPLAPILGHLDRELSPPGMFALSWLDARRLPPVPANTDVQYVSASIRTDGVMAWFLAGDAGLHVRCRYPDTPQARTNVTRWLDAIVSRITALTQHPLPTQER